MSTSLTKTKRRINSIESTEKTTKAMELIANVKTKRFRDAYEKGLLYSSEFRDLMGYLFGESPELLSHYGRENEGDLPSLYLAIGSNMGLCGAYNNNIYKLIEKTVKPTDYLAPIGSKTANHYLRNAMYPNIILDFKDLNSSLDFDAFHKNCIDLKTAFNEKKYKDIAIIYTHYVNSITFMPMVYRLLPVQIGKKNWPNDSFCPPLIEGGAKEMLHAIMPDYLISTLYSLLLESELSENASRRTAMDNANDNADELLKKLNIEYNKARQNAITQEITEVVGGANASK